MSKLILFISIDSGLPQNNRVSDYIDYLDLTDHY